ncbi:MAG TPA: hypothetical protein VG407_13330 [Caulobacteraceae bacterium]|jgi:hypothetical protein|nr:hypothetical protein [Caulobacteraceae bacterium]
MFEFGRELKKALGANDALGEADPCLLELLDVQALAARGRAGDIDAGRVSAKHPFPLWLRSAAVWREHARRTGDVLALRRAAAAAVSAGRCAASPAEQARATLEQALTSLLGADLYGDEVLTGATRNSLKIAAATEADDLGGAKIEHAHARLVSRDALACGDYAKALEAAALFDCVVHKLDTLAAAHRCSATRYEANLARIERADLLAGFGARLHDVKLLRRVEMNLAALLDQIDADYEPLLWVRGAEVLGAVETALGETQGHPETMARGAAILSKALERFTREHSPLDWARLQHALAVALQSLGDATENRAIYLEAERAFEDALEVVDGTSLMLRAMTASNRAACLARRAERTGDLNALSVAETVFKGEAAKIDPNNDPVGWAVLQINLARIYEARADLLGGFSNRDAAVYALEEAREVFCEHGLKTLAESATAGLERVRAV